MSFDPDQARFKTCCCLPCCHVKCCSIAIGVLEAVGIGIQLIASFFGAMGGVAMGAVTGVMLLFCIVAVVMLFIGIAKENGMLLIPHLIYQSIVIIFCIAAIVLASMGASVADKCRIQHPESSCNTLFWILMATIFVVLAYIFMQIWWIVVIAQCFAYFQEKRQLGVATIQMAPVQATTYVVTTGNTYPMLTAAPMYTKPPGSPA